MVGFFFLVFSVVFLFCWEGVWDWVGEVDWTETWGFYGKDLWVMFGRILQVLAQGRCFGYTD